MSNTAGQMRLQREAKMAVRDLDAQVKKNGKITDQNFICLPDPDNIYIWYYIVFGLEGEYKGGYYIGKIQCKDNYPAVAPNITIYTDQGKFRTFAMQKDGICLSISDFHPESWNPAWKVTQIVLGLVSFWLSGEYTYGSIESYDYSGQPYGATTSELKKMFAMKSRDHVMKHEKYPIFEKYAAAIGIDQPQDLPEWEPIKAKLAQLED
jgi:ubiquitin-conjugating enzyme E2 J2